MTMAVTPPPPSTGALRKLHDTETASAQNLTIRWVGAEAGGNNLLRTTLPRSDWPAARDLSVRAAAKPRPRREQKAATITCLQRPPLAFLYSLSAGALGTHARPQRHARPIAPAPPTRPIPAAAALACEACIRACMTSAATQTARPPGQQDQPRSQRAAVSGQAGPSARQPGCHDLLSSPPPPLLRAPPDALLSSPHPPSLPTATCLRRSCPSPTPLPARQLPQTMRAIDAACRN